MTVRLDIAEECAVKTFSEVLAAGTTAGEVVDVELGDVDVCPNRIVPVLGLADKYRREGRRIVFHVGGSGASSRACEGFVAGDMRPGAGIPRPFGRVWSFGNSDELNAIVNAMEQELNRSAELAKGVKLCFVWCLNEVMDNVLNHSSPNGQAMGYVMVQYLPSGKLLKVCVFDVGIGLFESFRNSVYEPKNAEEALLLAVRQNVTSGKGQGNGLWGLRCLVGQSPRGKLHIRSAGAEYLYNPVLGIEHARASWAVSRPEGTTTVDFQFVCDGELSFANVFPGAMELVDLWMEDREREDGTVVLRVLDEVSGCGSRDSAAELRNIVVNLIENDHKRVVLDFGQVETCSSGFVDELLGKLVLKYDFVAFMQFVGISNAHGIVALLINHSLAQRMASRA